MLKRLVKESTIGLTCPSGYIRPTQDLDGFVKRLTSHGFNVKVGKTCYLKEKYLAGTDIERASELQQMFVDDSIDAVLCFKGGYGCQRLIPYIDFNVIKNHPKLFMGFSDITIFLNSFYQKCGFPTVHGEMGVCMKTVDDATLDEFFHTLDYGFDRPLVNHKSSAVTLHDGVCEGVLVGGNLSLVYALMGTEYEIDLNDKILFIEDVDEAPYSVDRMLSSLLLSGKLNKLKGIICGYFTDCGSTIPNEDDYTVDELINNYFGHLDIPILTHFESGHDKPFTNLPIGLKVRLDATSKSVIALESLFVEKND